MILMILGMLVFTSSVFADGTDTGQTNSTTDGTNQTERSEKTSCLSISCGDGILTALVILNDIQSILKNYFTINNYYLNIQ